MAFTHRDEHRDGQMLVIQANIDDMNPEHCPYVTELLLEQGANDVWWVPIIMKKGRPGLMLNVLVDERMLSRMEDVIFTETTTIGLRYMHATCHRLGREFHLVETPWGMINVKAGYHNGKLVQYSPEFKDCEEAAKRHGIPLKAVYEEARRKFAELGGTHKA